jgi:putative glutathione S-transferase
VIHSLKNSDYSTKEIGMNKILVNGILSQASTQSNEKFIRPESVFRNWITEDGTSRFKAEPNRYHLFISPACPWSHRVMLMRELKGLNRVISVTELDAIKGENGWQFSQQSFPEWLEASAKHFLYEVYQLADPLYTGRITVPVLWDKKLATIVSNESADIMRMLNVAFESYALSQYDYNPLNLQGEINQINKFIYENISNGVYKAGFATVQTHYNEAVNSLFKAFDELDRRLSMRRYLVGNILTEADLMFFTTLIRFDVIYFVHFKLCLHKISDYEHLSEYLRELYQIPGISKTVDIEHMKKHYYLSHKQLNPNGIIPIGPVFDFTSPHLRDYMGTNNIEPFEQSHI